MNSENKKDDWPCRDRTSDYLAFDVRLLQRDGVLVPGTYFGSEWKRGDRVTAGIKGRTEGDRIVLRYWYRTTVERGPGFFARAMTVACE